MRVLHALFLWKDVGEAAKALLQLGFSLIELLCEEPHAHPDDLLRDGQVELLKKMSREFGVEWLIHAPVSDVNLMSPNRFMRAEAERQLRQTILLAREINCRRIVFHVGGRPRMGLYDPDKGFSQAVEIIDRLLSEAAKHDIALLLENDPVVDGLAAVTPKECSRFIQAFNGKLGFLLDVGHANLVDSTAASRFIHLLASSLQGVHLSDNRGQRDEHLGIGEGTVNMATLMEELTGISFQGELILELLTAEGLPPARKIIEGLIPNSFPVCEKEKATDVTNFSK